jgi:hypothetical protein
MDRYSTTFAGASVNRVTVLQFILIMLVLQRSRGSGPGEGSATFSFSPNDDLQLQGFPSRIECDAMSDFS